VGLGGAEHGAETSPPTGNGREGGGTGGWWGREPTWVGAWVQAAWVRGIKVVPTFLGDDHGSKQIDKWGRLLPRSRGVRVHLPRKRA